jgi:hypothetical protein
MKPERIAASLLVILLFVISAAAGDLNTPRSHTIGKKVVVMKGRVTFAGSKITDGMGEGPFLVLDRYARNRGRVEQLDAESLSAILREFRSGVYILVPGFDTPRHRQRGEQDVMTETGDIDGDGDEDIITARELLPARLLLNEDGSFVDRSEWLPQVSSYTTDIELVDVNGDSALDLYFTNNDEQNWLFINDGTAHFTDSTITHLPADSSSSQAASWGDVDGDGDNDIFVVNIGIPFDPLSEENQLLINDGDGHFTDETIARFLFEPRLDISFDSGILDTDGDHDLDIVIINDNFNGDQPRLLINNGNGQFTDETLQKFPAENGSCTRVSAGDVDGDENPDLYIANYFWEINFLWVNDGNGRFFDETEFRIPIDSPTDSSWSWGCEMADIENDQDADIVIGNFPVLADSVYAGRGRNRLLVNDGFGFFTDRTFQIFPDVEDSTNDVDFIDADANEYVDLYITNWGESNELKIDPGENVGIGGERQPPSLPVGFSLHQNYPNPFNPSTIIQFTVPSSPGGSRVTLAVYDIKGRLVKRLVDGRLEPGLHRTAWDGRDDRGMKVASGVYLARITVDGRKRNIKMSLLK